MLSRPCGRCTPRSAPRGRRSLKASNVLVNSSLRAKLSDYAGLSAGGGGVPARAGGGGSARSLLRAGSLWAAPEILKGGDVTEQSEVRVTEKKTWWWWW